MRSASKRATPGLRSWWSTRSLASDAWPVFATLRPVPSSFHSPPHNSRRGLLVVFDADECRYGARNLLGLFERLGDLGRVIVSFDMVEGDAPGLEKRLG